MYIFSSCFILWTHNSAFDFFKWEQGPLKKKNEKFMSLQKQETLPEDKVVLWLAALSWSLEKQTAKKYYSDTSKWVQGNFCKKCKGLGWFSSTYWPLSIQQLCFLLLSCEPNTDIVMSSISTQIHRTIAEIKKCHWRSSSLSPLVRVRLTRMSCSWPRAIFNVLSTDEDSITRSAACSGVCAPFQ